MEFDEFRAMMMAQWENDPFKMSYFYVDEKDYQRYGMGVELRNCPFLIKDKFVIEWGPYVMIIMYAMN